MYVQSQSVTTAVKRPLWQHGVLLYAHEMLHFGSLSAEAALHRQAVIQRLANKTVSSLIAHGSTAALTALLLTQQRRNINAAMQAQQVTLMSNSAAAQLEAVVPTGHAAADVTHDDQSSPVTGEVAKCAAAAASVEQAVSATASLVDLDSTPTTAPPESTVNLVPALVRAVAERFVLRVLHTAESCTLGRIRAEQRRHTKAAQQVDRQTGIEAAFDTTAAAPVAPPAYANDAASRQEEALLYSDDAAVEVLELSLH